MNQLTCSYRVPYADTDQMGVVYYANYLTYFERSRTEMLRELGFPYRVVEEAGFLLAVSEANCQYIQAAHYDDLLCFESWIESSRAASLKVCTRIMRDGVLIAKGYVILACLDCQTKRITKLPEFLKKLCPTE